MIDFIVWALVPKKSSSSFSMHVVSTPSWTILLTIMGYMASCFQYSWQLRLRLALIHVQWVRIVLFTQVVVTMGVKSRWAVACVVMLVTEQYLASLRMSARCPWHPPQLHVFMAVAILAICCFNRFVVEFECWRLTDDFLDGHGCNDGMDFFTDCSFIGCWWQHGFKVNRRLKRCSSICGNAIKLVLLRVKNSNHCWA